jgi:acyl-CoA reductase-like NAD-dependent aldehyde dehydrogenase
MERLRSHVDGRWRYEQPGGEFDVLDPSTGSRIATASRAGEALVGEAASVARAAFDEYRWMPAFERAALCSRVAELLDDRRDRLARELSEEHGKPIAEADAEVGFAVAGMQLFAEEARRLEGHAPVVADPTKRALVVRQARGTWAFLTPWNFPLNIPVEYIGPALAAGCTFVWKPAPTTARIAVRLMEILVDAAIPDGVANLVLTDEVAAAERLVTDPRITAVGLTGGSATGARVAQLAWDKHLLLELGGNTPILVLSDAEPGAAARAIAEASFFNAGQVCTATGRVIVADPIADVLVSELAREASRIVLGAPLEPGTMMGPVHTDPVVAGVERDVADAIDRGASVVAGGGRAAGLGSPLFFRPTVLDHVPIEARVFQEETFGPVAPIVRAGADEDVLSLANRTRHGLAAAVFTRSLGAAFRLAERVDAGMVSVNGSSNYWEHQLPFGGWAGTLSGRGRLGGRGALDEFTQSKLITFDLGVEHARN